MTLPHNPLEKYFDINNNFAPLIQRNPCEHERTRFWKSVFTGKIKGQFTCYLMNPKDSALVRIFNNFLFEIPVCPYFDRGGCPCKINRGYMQ